MNQTNQTNELLYAILWQILYELDAMYAARGLTRLDIQRQRITVHWNMLETMHKGTDPKKMFPDIPNRLP